MLHPAYGLRPAPLDTCRMRPSHRGVVAPAKAAENISAAPTFTLTARATASTSWLDVASAGFPGLDVGQYSVEVEKASLIDAVESPRGAALSY